MPAGTELCTFGAEALAEGAGAAAGVRGVLKGCATPGFDVAAGAPVAERGVAVVEVSAVMGVESREGVVVKARARAGVRRERQRVQSMVVSSVWLFWCIGFGVARPMVCLPSWLLWEVRDVESPEAEGRSLGGDARRCWLGT